MIAFFSLSATWAPSLSPAYAAARCSPTASVVAEKAVDFDVVAKTKEFISSASGYYSPVDESFYDDDFVFRAPSIGPLNKKDYFYTMTSLNVYTGYPDLAANAFGHTVDPSNPLKCIFWTRASGTFTQQWNPFGKPAASLPFATLQPNNRRAQLPTECYSITFTPEGKAKLLTAGYVVNRFEGNTNGLGAVLALFVNADLPQMADIALNENARSAVNWLSENVDGAIAKTRSEPGDLPAWYEE